jgi:hypothetical protein
MPRGPKGEKRPAAAGTDFRLTHYQNSEYDDFGADPQVFVEFGNLLVQHADAAR